MSARESDVLRYLQGNAQPRDLTSEADLRAYLGDDAGRTWEKQKPGVVGRVNAVLAGLGNTIGFGLDDEVGGFVRGVLPGGRSISEATHDERVARNVSQMQDPRGYMVGQVAGVAAPLGALRVATAPGANVLMNALRSVGLGNTAATLGTGGAIGFAQGFGNAEGPIGERSTEALDDAAIGAGLGFGLGTVLPRTYRALKGAPTRDAVANEFGQLARVPQGKIADAVSATRAEARKVKESLWKQLESSFPAIDDPVIKHIVSRRDILPVAEKVLTKEVIESGRPLSFVELQSVHNKLASKSNVALRKGDGSAAKTWQDAADDFRNEIDRVTDGRFTQARTATREIKAAEKAFERGAALVRKSPEFIEAEIARLPSQLARQNVKLGMAAKYFDMMASKGGRLTKDDVAKMESLGMRERLKSMFQSVDDYNTFMRNIRKHGQAEVDRTRLKRTFQAALATGAAAGLGAGAYMGAKRGASILGDF